MSRALPPALDQVHHPNKTVCRFCLFVRGVYFSSLAAMGGETRAAPTLRAPVQSLAKAFASCREDVRVHAWMDGRTSVLVDGVVVWCRQCSTGSVLSDT